MGFQWAWDEIDDNSIEESNSSEGSNSLFDELEEEYNFGEEDTDELVVNSYNAVEDKKEESVPSWFDELEEEYLSEETKEENIEEITLEDSSQVDRDYSKYLVVKEPKEKEKKVYSVAPAMGTSVGKDSLHTRETKREVVPYIRITDEDREKAKEEYYKQDKLSRTKGTVLATEESRQAVISPSGMTLDELLRNKRKSNKKKNTVETAQELIEREREGQLSKPYEDNPYLRRFKKTEQDIKREKRHRKEAHSKNLFLDKNKRGTKDERRILKTLGITKGDLHKLVEPGSSLTEKEKATLLSSGHFGKQGKLSGDSRRTKYVKTGDLEYLYFLDKFKFASTKMLLFAVGKRNLSKTRAHLNRLRNMGLISFIDIIGTTGLWVLTQTGAVYIGSERNLPTNKQAEPHSLLERLYVNHVAALLWSNKVNAMNLDDFPYNGRISNDDYVRGEEIIPESDIMSSYGKARVLVSGDLFKKESFKGERARQFAEQWEIMWRRWEMSGREDIAPDEIEGNEFAFTLFRNDDLAYSAKQVIPDLVIRRPRKADKSPGNIAIEIEKHPHRSVGYYVAKLKTYQLDNRVYDKVIYITPSASIANKIATAAEQINFDRYDVVPMMDYNGNPTNEKSPWKLMEMEWEGME